MVNMGGIAGTVKLDGTFAVREDLQRAQKILAHRGSNKRGMHLDRELGMAHNRMAMIDISDAGNQPMCAMGGRYWISFDGELYNFIELKQELETMGYRFQSNADTEVALAAFVAWGKECFSQFNGIWALAIWDTEERRLTLSRDSFGFKPLYYYQDKKQFVYVSEVKGLLGFESIHLEFDLNAVASTYNQASIIHATEVTPWVGVKKVLPGYSIQVEANEGSVECERWWRPLERLPEVPSNLNDRTEKFRELFFKACRQRMRADIPIGLCVSGGLTSASIWNVVNYLNQESFENITPDCTFASHLVFQGESSKELRHAEALIKETKGKGKLFKAHPEDFANDIQNFIYTFESLEALSLERWLLYRSLSQNAIHLTLEGLGANALLGRLPLGVIHYAFDQLRGIQSAKAALKNRKMWKECVTDKRLPKMSVYDSQSILDPRDFTLGPHASFATGESESLCSPYWKQDSDQMQERDLFFQSKYYATHGGLLQRDLSIAEAASISQGVQIRSPFLDPDFFSYCLALPSESVIFQGQTQVILRKAMQGFVSHEILQNQRQYVLPSVHEVWYETRLNTLIVDCVSSFSFRNFSVINGNEVKDLIKNKRFADAWPYVQAFLLNERFIEIREDLFPD